MIQLSASNLPLIVIGTRPEAIKLAPVVKCLHRHNSPATVCVTGQHADLVGPVLDLFKIKPHATLACGRGGPSLSLLLSRLIRLLSAIITTYRPSCVIGQGDTSSCLAAALAAFYGHVPFVHVEAGLRTHNLMDPWPEEMHRRFADMVADICFAPTEGAAAILLADGAKQVYLSGNTIVDAVLDISRRDADLIPASKPQILITAHRRESFGQPLESICEAVQTLAESHPNVRFIWPVHPNPIVRATVEAMPGSPNLLRIGPLSYGESLRTIRRSILVLTDSGGLQEEAATLNVPCFVLRDTTERPEGVEVGMAKLVGTERDKIVLEVTAILNDEAARVGMVAGKPNPYGDGHAAERIVAKLEEIGLCGPATADVECTAVDYAPLRRGGVV